MGKGKIPVAPRRQIGERGSKGFHQLIVDRARDIQKEQLWASHNRMEVPNHAALRVASNLSTKSFECVINRMNDIYEELEVKEKEHKLKKIEPGFTANILPMLECKTCGNNNYDWFRKDKEGSIICLGIELRGCGEILFYDNVHEGCMFRTFADGEDRNSNGPAYNPLMSVGYNFGTMTTKPGKSRSNGGSTCKEVNLVISNIGKDPRMTTTEFKDDQKLKAFARMTEAATKEQVHVEALDRAKVLFAVFRNNMEHVVDLDTTIAACMVGGILEMLENQEVNGDVPSFPCGSCTASFNCLRDRDTHIKECPAAQKRVKTSVAISSKDINVPNLPSFTEPDLRNFLNGMSKKVQDNVDAILESLQDENKENIDPVIGRIFVTTSLKKLTDWCGGDIVPAQEIIAAIRKISIQRDKKRKLEEAESHQMLREKQRFMYEQMYLGQHMKLSSK